jgi:hypothetical protein
MPANVSITQDTSNPYSESDISINPYNPLQIVAASNQNISLDQAQYFSGDGGSTWSQSSLPLTGGDNFTFDPAVSWTSDGTAWSLTNGSNISTGAIVVRAYKLSAGSSAWTYDSLVSGAQTGTDKPSIWVDRSATSFKDNMYAIWHQVATAYVNVRNGPGGSWGTPQAVSGSETTFTADGGDIKTNAFGDVFAFWPDAGGQTLRVVKSTNGGASFGALGSTPIQIATTSGSFTIKVPAQATRTTSGGGTIGALIYITGGAYRDATNDLVFACWHDLAGGTGCNAPSDAPVSNAASPCKTRIWFARSLNGGKNWQPAVKINDQTGLNDQFFPRFAVDDLTGNLMVVYYDTVGDPNRVNTNIWMQYSVDGGATWSGATKVTTATTDEASGAEDNSQQYGDYIGMSSGGGRYFACWTDRRSGGNEQIWGAPLAIPSMGFVFGKSTFSQDEVSAGEAFNPAFYINVAGFTNESLGLSNVNSKPTNIPTVTAKVDSSLNPSLMSSQIATIAANLPTVSFGPLPIQADDPSLTEELQSLFYPYTITFPSSSSLSNLYGALNPDQYVFVTLTATFKVGNLSFTAQALIELTKGEDPYFENLDNANPKAYPVWLSYDLRFFKATPTQMTELFSIPNPSGAADCNRYIQAVINSLNSTNGGQFDNAFSPDEEKSALEFLPADTSGNPTFNFAVARVRIQSNQSETIGPVRVFFRLFPVQSTSTAFAEVDTNEGAYRWGTDGSTGHKIALMGVQKDQNGNLEWATIPCFATARVNLPPANAKMNTQHDDPYNARQITTIAGKEVDTFYGCWLDLNQQGQVGPPNLPAQLIFPASPPSSQADWDGSYTGTLVSINEIITQAPHQCLVAEIRFDDTPVPPGADTTDSDKLAQRNIAWINGPNPGVDASRVMAHPFEVRASSPSAAEVDEMLVFWGATPVGSTASFYLPAVPAAEIIALANEMYPAHRLSVIDDHTVGCPVGNATLVPIPKGVGSFAGLLSVNLPRGIRRGDSYDIVVRQLTIATAVPYTPPPIQIQIAKPAITPVEQPFSWRKTSGAFQATITISTKEELLYPAERLLAWLKWKVSVVPKTLRFYPVLVRYLGIVTGLVGGFGGKPGLIPLSPSGTVPGHPVHPLPAPHHAVGLIEFTGKVVALMYDRFGDFAGFKLLTEHGHEHEFHGREPAVEALVKGAWIERSVISVHVEEHRREWPTSIVLRRYH